MKGLMYVCLSFISVYTLVFLFNMKLAFTPVFAFVFIISSVACADKHIEDHQQGENAKIEACLEGIADSNGFVTGITKDLNTLIHTDIKDLKKIQEIQLKLFQDGQIALTKYGTFNPECKNITAKYTYQQDTILLKGIIPLLESVSSLYKGLLNQKNKVEQLHMGDLLSGFLTAVTHAVDEFKTWRHNYGSERVIEATSMLVDDVYILIDELLLTLLYKT
ncbi:hypothetical protein K501DRAFT_270130 [Backusella circina FSU 941]|nr:hypothetical protein K501DRAFT_270130 [Backusella circina FSU 941]